MPTVVEETSSEGPGKVKYLLLTIAVFEINPIKGAL